MRRSSRQQPPPPVAGSGSGPGSSTSGPSSTVSARLERSTRSNNKQSSPQKSATPQSALSSENNDTEDGAAPLARRSKRGQHDPSRAEGEDVAKVQEDEEVGEEGGEEEEITRCLCGQAEYPGPPEVRSKSNHPALDAQSDDAGGLFIQCDVCKVWQHGGCVGIMDEAASPDDYFCEQCRPDYHEVSTAKNGQKYSLYLPVHEKLTAKASHRKASTSKEADVRAAKEKEKALRAEALAKRRSTMNSRSAYDEEEVLRAVLEQSKNDGGAGSENSLRKAKRGRDDSEELNKGAKRQKTVTEGSSDVEDTHSQAAESESDSKTTRQKPRGAAARSHRDREQREERERTDTASRRKGRGDRRRGEDSEPPDNTLRPSTAPSDVDGPTSQPPDTPQLGPLTTKSHKKGPKAPSKRGKNQWTRDNTHTPLEADVPVANGERRSRRGAGEDTSPPRNARSGDNTDAGGGGGSAKEPAEPNGVAQPVPALHKAHGRVRGQKQLNVHKTSMNEMRRRVNNMLQAISQAQVDLAGKKSFQLAVHSALNGSTAEKHTDSELNGNLVTGVEKENEQTGSASNSSASTRGFGMLFEDFEKLPHTEQANLLSTQLVLWQQEFGKAGEK